MPWMNLLYMDLHVTGCGRSNLAPGHIGVGVDLDTCVSGLQLTLAAQSQWLVYAV